MTQNLLHHDTVIEIANRYVRHSRSVSKGPYIENFILAIEEALEIAQKFQEAKAQDGSPNSRKPNLICICGLRGPHICPFYPGAVNK